jgi:hypothetical protein
MGTLLPLMSQSAAESGTEALGSRLQAWRIKHRIENKHIKFLRSDFRLSE